MFRLFARIPEIYGTVRYLRDTPKTMSPGADLLIVCRRLNDYSYERERPFWRRRQLRR